MAQLDFHRGKLSGCGSISSISVTIISYLYDFFQRESTNFGQPRARASNSPTDPRAHGVDSFAGWLSLISTEGNCLDVALSARSASRSFRTYMIFFNVKARILDNRAPALQIRPLTLGLMVWTRLLDGSA